MPLPQAQPTLIITGPYGSGKTECALALGTQWAATESVALVDLDFVNPYFRTQDCRAELEQRGIRLIAPEARVASIDAPSLPPETRTALLQPAGRTIVDLGGDPAGAIVIAQFARDLRQYDLWAVINFFRPTTGDPAQAADALREIACATALRLTGLISNTHFGTGTTAEDILDGLAQARATATILDIPVVLLAAPAGLALPPLDLPILPITPRLHKPWE